MRVELEYAIFGRLLKERRRKEKLSQRELRKVVGLNRVSMGNIESGKQRIMLRQALLLAQALDFSLDDVNTQIVASKLPNKLSEQPPKLKSLLEKIINPDSKEVI